MLAANPNWAEILTAFATLGAAVGVLFAWRQLHLETQEEKRATRIREAERALNLMRPLIELERVVVDHPELGPYFQNVDGEALQPPAPAADDSGLRAKVFAHATAYVNHAEAVGWQMSEMGAQGQTDWARFFDDLYKTNPTIRTVVDAKCDLLSGDTLRLFGVTSKNDDDD